MFLRHGKRTKLKVLGHESEQSKGKRPHKRPTRRTGKDQKKGNPECWGLNQRYLGGGSGVNGESKKNLGVPSQEEEGPI